MSVDLDTLLSDAVARGASDLHLKVDVPPYLRIDGVLRPMDHTPLTAADTRQLAIRLLEDHDVDVDEIKEFDASYAIYALGRFRCNVFVERGVHGAVLRVIPGQTKTIADLHLPPIIEKISLEERGLVLCTGTTGSGKSTTLASMIDHINRNKARHIVTIEDPIEFLHSGGKSIITQRELGQDTGSYAGALRAALRQDPDIILVGEMRDKETIETALTAAETGHLVMSTLHTLDAPETINRIIAVFPPYQQEQIRAQLAEVIKAVVSMRLVRQADGRGRVPAAEIMLATTFIRECIRDRERVVEIRDAIAAGVSQYGMQTFDQSLLWLTRKDLISVEEALAAATNPNDMKLQLRGIVTSSEAAEQTMETMRTRPGDSA
ncbi:MAG TPA: type IV pilus twitching motility protein PilT [Acidobacteriota bacterium]